MLKTYKHSLQKFKKNNEANLTYEEWKKVFFFKKKNEPTAMRESKLQSLVEAWVGEDKELGSIKVSIT